MHINAKHMKRRINKGENQPPAVCHFYGSPNLITDPDEILIDPITTPDYVDVTDYRERAALLGITITEAAGDSGKEYTLSGGCMLDLEAPPETYPDTEALAAAINSYWEIETEPTAEYYTDGSGRLHKYIEYPDLEFQQ